MKKGQEIYLISFALVLLAAILLYEVYMTPKLSPAVIKETVGTSDVVENTSQANTDNSKNRSTNNSKNNSNNQDFTKKNAVTTNTSSNLVNINTADVNQLATLPGIGEVKANEIIAYRLSNGNYSCADDLVNVKGIGIKTVNKFRDRITF